MYIHTLVVTGTSIPRRKVSTSICSTRAAKRPSDVWALFGPTAQRAHSLSSPRIASQVEAMGQPANLQRSVHDITLIWASASSIEQDKRKAPKTGRATAAGATPNTPEGTNRSVSKPGTGLSLWTTPGFKMRNLPWHRQRHLSTRTECWTVVQRRFI
jgi:hypothetical protein